MKLETYRQAKTIQREINRIKEEISFLDRKMKEFLNSNREIGGVQLTDDEFKILIEKREFALMKLQKEFDEL